MMRVNNIHEIKIKKNQTIETEPFLYSIVNEHRFYTCSSFREDDEITIVLCSDKADAHYSNWYDYKIFNIALLRTEDANNFLQNEQEYYIDHLATVFDKEGNAWHLLNKKIPKRRTEN